MTETVDLPSTFTPPSDALSATDTVDLPEGITPSGSNFAGLETVDIPAEQTPPVAGVGQRVKQKAQQISASGKMDKAPSMSAKASSFPLHTLF